MKRILFFGDSNTYGFDPRDGGRYPEHVRWTGILSRTLEEWEVIADGLNGRRIPSFPAAEAYLAGAMEKVLPLDCFAVMLGTNDLLWQMHPSSGEMCRKMDYFLKYIRGIAGNDCRILLIAPPQFSYGSEERENDFYKNLSGKMAEGFQRIAEQNGYFFADAEKWNIRLGFDGVHFSEEGHRRFAEKMEEIIRSQLQRDNGCSSPPFPPASPSCRC